MSKKTDIEKIQELYAQVDNKTKFLKEAAEEFDKSPRTLRVHWFAESGFWSIPEEYQKGVIKFLKKKIKSQKQPA